MTTAAKKTVRVWIQGNCFRPEIMMMLVRYYGPVIYKEAESIEKADMILYAGGADISPQLYGEPTLQGTYVNHNQDKSDVACFHKAKALNKFQVGICRGAQLLNVLNGGTLWQDINHHAGMPHLVEDCITKKVFEVSSLHHQGIILPLDREAVLLAYCNEADYKKSADGMWKKTISKSPSTDVEAFWIEKTKCLGVQWHPEIGPKECVDLFFSYIEMFKDEACGGKPLNNNVEKAA